jgi:hypothetical protein
MMMMMTMMYDLKQDNSRDEAAFWRIPLSPNLSSEARGSLDD